MEKITIKFYRHKVFKDIYLKRNLHRCGSSEAEWFEGTKNLLEALRSYEDRDCESEYKEHFYDKESKHSKLNAKITIDKEVDFDGFKGKLKKELVLPLDDFELIKLIEANWD